MRTTKVLAILLMVILVFSLAGCGKVTEKITEKGMEKLLEKQLGSDIDFSKDGFSIKSDEGSMQVGDDLKWPKDKMGNLPKPDGKIVFILDAEGGCSVTLEEFNKKTAEKYIDELKDMGYEEVTMMDSDTGFVFSGQKGNTNVNVTYTSDSEEGIIIYSKED